MGNLAHRTQRWFTRAAFCPFPAPTPRNGTAMATTSTTPCRWGGWVGKCLVGAKVVEVVGDGVCAWYRMTEPTQMTQPSERHLADATSLRQRLSAAGGPDSSGFIARFNTTRRTAIHLLPAYTMSTLKPTTYPTSTTPTTSTTRAPPTPTPHHLDGPH